MLSFYSSGLLVEAVSQSFSYSSSSSSPLFFKFTSVHTFLQEQITILECQPPEWDHQTSNVVDCKFEKKKKNPLGTNMRTKLKSLCVYIKGEEDEGPQFIHSVSKKNSSCRVPALSFKTSLCE